MDKQEVMEKLASYYEEEMKDNQIYQQGKNNQELMEKLMYTTELFVRSFDYDLPVAHTLIAKLKNFIRRIIRRSTRFITRPYAENMQRYNESVCELLGQIISQFDKRIMNLEHQNKKIHDAHEELTVKFESREEVEKYKIERREEFEKYKAENNDVIDSIKAVLNDTVNKTLEMGGQITVLSNGIFENDEKEWMSYSQAGEDRIVDYMLNYGRDDIGLISYLDIGCNHYRNINNTYAFYKKGHRGVLVEANPSFIDELKKNRPGDVVLNVGIGAENIAEQSFYIVNNVDLSSFSKQSIEDAKKESPWLEIVEEIKVPIMRMDKVIDDYCNGIPDIVSLDVEGLEMEILSALDFDKYRPQIFIIETISYAAKLQIDKKRKDILKFMNEKGYSEFAFTGINSIFVDTFEKETNS